MAGLMMLLFFALFVAVLVAWLMSINLLVKVGAAKGYSMDNKGLLWFIGIFATPIVVGLYVASLPDNRAPQTKPDSDSNHPVSGDLFSENSSVI